MSWHGACVCARVCVCQSVLCMRWICELVGGVNVYRQNKKWISLPRPSHLYWTSVHIYQHFDIFYSSVGLYTMAHLNASYFSLRYSSFACFALQVWFRRTVNGPKKKEQVKKRHTMQLQVAFDSYVRVINHIV